MGGWALLPITSLQRDHCPIFLFFPYILGKGGVLMGRELWLDRFGSGLGGWLRV